MEIRTKFNRWQCCLSDPNIFSEVFISKDFHMYTALDEIKGAFCLSELASQMYKFEGLIL